MSDPVREALSDLCKLVEIGASDKKLVNSASKARAALAAPSAVEEMTAAMRECLAMFDSHMDTLYGHGHDVPLASGVELIRRKFVALIAKYAGAAPCNRCGGTGWLEPIGPREDGSYITSRPCPKCAGAAP